MNPSDPWSDSSTVEGFATGTPNSHLIDVARAELPRVPNGHLLDIGCGAGRNAVPLAALGWRVIGIDLSVPMLTAALARAESESVTLRVARADMQRLPIADRSCDVIVAHGIWNLAASDDVRQEAMREAARVARASAALFVYTFVRDDLVASLEAAGFVPDAMLPLHVINPRQAGRTYLSGPPPIHEGLFRRR
jgi:ubiquinone/menaquinone biosynthesis C-methylase UbiE